MKKVTVTYVLTYKQRVVIEAEVDENSHQDLCTAVLNTTDPLLERGEGVIGQMEHCSDYETQRIVVDGEIIQ